MLNLTLEQINNSFPQIERVAEETPEDQKLAYQLGRIFDAVLSEYKLLQKQRLAMLKKYAKPVPDTERWRFNNEADQSAYDAQWEHLLTQQVEIWGRAYKFSEIEEKLKLSPAEYRALSWLIVPDEEESGEAGSEAGAKLKAKAQRKI